MSAKASAKSAPSKKSATPKKASPSAGPQKKAAAKASAPADEKMDDVTEATESSAPAIDPDELEEQEDAAASGSSGQNSNAAALAAATGGTTEISASLKNFRHHPDMENFYRFIYENDLRHEALAIIDEIMVDKQEKKAAKSAKSHAH